MVQCLMEMDARRGTETGTESIPPHLRPHALQVNGSKSNTRVERSGEMMAQPNTPAQRASFLLVVHAIHGGDNVMEQCSMETLAESTTVPVTITRLYRLTASQSMDGLRQE